jgi:mannose-6-phosphate isomerase
MTPKKPLLTPIFFKPIFKEKIWGGQNLKTSLTKDIPPNSTIGESWELSGYSSDLSVAITEECNNLSIQHILEKNPKGLLGDIPDTGVFPLLYKFIDANDKLSVQVHPDNTQVRQNNWGNSGKTECWYIADAKPGAQIIVGFKEGATLSDVESGIKNNTLDLLLNQIPVTKGDMLFIPSRTVHAILDGTLLYEVQETSDITFRLYDWGRVDKTGKPRQLHIAESLKTVDTTYHDQHKIPPVSVEPIKGVKHSFRVVCKYFAIEEYYFEDSHTITLSSKKSFSVITVLDGSIVINTDSKVNFPVVKGQTVLIPADCYSNTIIVDGEVNSRFILSTVPDLKSEIIDPLKNFGISNDEIALLGGSPASNELIHLL